MDVSATYPAAALRLSKIGYQLSPNAKGILAMLPAVFVGSTGAGPSQIIEQIRFTSVPVVSLGPVNTLAGVLKKIRDVA